MSARLHFGQNCMLDDDRIAGVQSDSYLMLPFLLSLRLRQDPYPHFREDVVTILSQTGKGAAFDSLLIFHPQLSQSMSTKSLLWWSYLLGRQYTGDLTCVDDGRAVKLMPIIVASIIFRITKE